MSNFIYRELGLTKKNGFAAAENTIARRMSVMETVAKPQAAVSFFDQEDEVSKDQVLPKPWSPGRALRKVEKLCAIHEANVTIASSVSDANRIEKKTGRPSWQGAAR
jgi:hypothetical protein